MYGKLDVKDDNLHLRKYPFHKVDNKDFFIGRSIQESCQFTDWLAYCSYRRVMLPDTNIMPSSTSTTLVQDATGYELHLCAANKY